MSDYWVWSLLFFEFGIGVVCIAWAYERGKNANKKLHEDEWGRLRTIFGAEIEAALIKRLEILSTPLTPFAESSEPTPKKPKKSGAR